MKIQKKMWRGGGRFGGGGGGGFRLGGVTVDVNEGFVKIQEKKLGGGGVRGVGLWGQGGCE